MIQFTEPSYYVDYNSDNIQEKAKQLFPDTMSDIEKARVAYEFVRDEIPHTFDINGSDITAKASDVLKYKTGICHAKSNLLVALLRSQGIPSGFCFQHITLDNDDSLGYCVHAYVAAWLNEKWIRLDARGNTNGKNAQFSLDEPVLAFENRAEYDEYFWDGIFINPQKESMEMLEKASSIQDIMDNIPDFMKDKPDAID